MTDCVFCDRTVLRAAEVYVENDYCVYASTPRPRRPARRPAGMRRDHDEPLADAGGRSAIKVPENVRPDPAKPGNGRAKSFGRQA